ncbi:hypothetical protein C1H46_040277 [Malus baccata]|uniref:Uncharacterized protein n=1 Tax=Malus baccata TaxID=106549 RepID=A0A540KJL8_MALBA|nr:hypothetical protein C1H46_040277 [Malus baccata]
MEVTDAKAALPGADYLLHAVPVQVFHSHSYPETEQSVFVSDRGSSLTITKLHESGGGGRGCINSRSCDCTGTEAQREDAGFDRGCPDYRPRTDPEESGSGADEHPSGPPLLDNKKISNGFWLKKSEPVDYFK